MENRRRQIIEFLNNPKESNDDIKFIYDILNDMVKFADKHNIDRDEFIEYIAYMITTLSETTTFKNYK